MHSKTAGIIQAVAEMIKAFIFICILVGKMLTLFHQTNIITMSAKPESPKRLHYMDILKGMAIFMVVMGHVLTMCVREIDRSTLFKFIGEIHMPLFFFISGWFTLKLGENGNWRRPAIIPRAKRLILPMLAMSTLWIFYFPHSGLQSPLNSTFYGLWHDLWKNGYWFTLVLFEIFVIYWLISGVMTALRRVWAQIAFTVVGWGLLLWISQLLSEEVSNMLMMPLIARFFPVFMAGAIASAHRDKFSRLTVSSPCFTVAVLVAAVLLYFICWPWEFENWHIRLGEEFAIDVELARSLFQILLAYIAITAISPWSNAAFADNPTGRGHRFARMWQYLGQESLAIYLMHYFFLFPMGVWRPVLESLNLGFVPCFVFSAFWAAAIIAVVLGVNYLIRPSRLLSFLMAGRVSR